MNRLAVNRLDIGNMTGGETSKAVNRPAPGEIARPSGMSNIDLSDHVHYIARVPLMNI